MSEGIAVEVLRLLQQRETLAKPLMFYLYKTRNNDLVNLCTGSLKAIFHWEKYSVKSRIFHHHTCCFYKSNYNDTTTYSRKLRCAFKGEVKGHCLEKKAHKTPSPSPHKISMFLAFKRFLKFSMFFKMGIAFDNRRQKRVRICLGYHNCFTFQCPLHITQNNNSMLLKSKQTFYLY